jgi:histidyl-tRNA synthetase
VADRAPGIDAFLTPEASAFFEAVKAGLTAAGVKFERNERLVRGLDYYRHTAFEFVTDRLGAQGTVLAGGRYDGLMEILGGQSLSGIGFGLGVDRALLAAIAERSLPAQDFTSDLFLIPLGESAMQVALTTAQVLRDAGIRTEIAFGDRALKGAMKAADKSGARYVVVLGDSELSSGDVDLKRMSDGVITSVKITQLRDQLRQALSL